MARPMDQPAIPREGGEGSRRRDRHRRGDRGERPERAEPQAIGSGVDNTGLPVAPENQAPAADTARADQPDAAPPMMPAPMMPAPPIRAVEPPRAAESAAVERVVAPFVAPVAPAPETVAVPRPAAPLPRPIEVLPPVSMTLPANSSLELVETRSKAIPMPEPDAPPPVGPRRVRPPRVVIAEEPLQIVETHKEGQPPAG